MLRDREMPKHFTRKYIDLNSVILTSKARKDLGQICEKATR
jgi:hypothetical protein